MNYKLKNVNGKVAFLLRAGKDLVKGHLSHSQTQHIIDTGTIKKSYIKDYPICVDDRWYFEGELMKKAAPRKETEVTSQTEDEPVPQNEEAE